MFGEVVTKQIVPVFFWFTVYSDLNFPVFTSEISAATKYFYNFYRSCDVLAFGAPARPKIAMYYFLARL